MSARSNTDGLVHVIPKAGDAHRDEIFVEAAPPIAHAGEREIGEDAVAGPDCADENGAIGILDEDVLLDSGIVGSVAVVRIFLDVEVGDGDGVEALRAEVGDHLLEVREIFAIDGERRVALLVVDVEIDHVGGNFLFAKEAHDFTGARFGIVAVAALLVAEAPERRQRRAADERGVFRDDFLRIGAGEEIVVQLAAFGAEGKIVGRFLAEIEAAAVGVVEKKAVRGAFAEADEKRNGLVERIGGFAPAEGVGIPVCEGAVAAIHGAGLVAQAVVVFVWRHFLPDADAPAIPGHRQGGLIGENDAALGIGERDEQRRFVNDDGDAAG